MRKEIVELRKLMASDGIDAYYVPSGDFHGSEYVNAFFRTRAFLSGFTGSAGELLITADGAWLWTDGTADTSCRHPNSLREAALSS